MPDYLSRNGQVSAVLTQVMQRQELGQARIYAALASIGASESGQIFLADLVNTVVLRPCTTPFEQGEQHLALKLLAAFAEATEKRHVSFEEHVHVRFDDTPSYGEHNPAGPWSRGDDTAPADPDGQWSDPGGTASGGDSWGLDAGD